MTTTTAETTTTMEAAPYLAVALVQDCALLLCAPLSTSLVSLASGEVLASWSFDIAEHAPRNVASVSLEGSSSSTKIDSLIAFVGDDKVLNVYRVSGSTASESSVKTTKLFSQAIPKRAVKMLWEDESETERRLIVGDRAGDVRSYVVSTTAQDQVMAEVEGEGKQPAEDALVAQSDTIPGEKMEDEEEAGTLHVGHVSFLTDFALSSFTTPAPSAAQRSSFIITSDRDEHIRISRWGPRRAGYIALRFLLGSHEAVSSICVIEGSAATLLRSASALNDRGKLVCAHPILLSSDESTLRLWSLHPDSEAGSREDCQAAFNVASALQPYAVVDAWNERRRGRFFGKGKPKTTQQQREEAPTNGPQHEPDFTPVITRLRYFVVDGEVYLAFTADGAKALFTASVAALTSSMSAEEAAQHISAVDVGTPVLDYALQQHGDETDAWLVTDIRSDFVTDASRPSPLTLLRWNRTGKHFNIISEHAVLSKNLPAQAPSDVVSALIVYDALTLFNKQEFEAVDGYQAMSPEGLVRGGLANFEVLGRPRGNPNRGNSEHTTRKREQARAVMKQRIQARLAQ